MGQLGRRTGSFVTPLGHPLDIFIIFGHSQPWAPNEHFCCTSWDSLGHPADATLNLPGPCCKTIQQTKNSCLFGTSLWSPFGEGGTCNAFTPVQSKPAFAMFVWFHFSPELTNRSDCASDLWRAYCQAMGGKVGTMVPHGTL